MEDRTGSFPKVLEPAGHMNWWFWGAMGLGAGMWGGIIAGVRWLA